MNGLMVSPMKTVNLLITVYEDDVVAGNALSMWGDRVAAELMKDNFE